jgi:glutathione S-transferase
MIFYDCSTAPSPRRVRIFIAEKGIEVPTVQIDLRNREQLGEAFRKINPHCTVPALQLDSGACLWDSNSICRYLEEIHPEPNLMGRDAEERAVISTWHRHVEWDGFAAAGEAFRNRSKGLAGRAMVGSLNLEQIPELAERGRARLRHFLDGLEERLGQSPYIAGERYTVADITAFVAIGFMQWIKEEIPADATNLRRWFDEISARPGSVL